jgi:hypothetical protein
LAAAGLLAAGIGVTTFIFSAVDAIILRPLPVAHPEQLVHFVQRLPRIGLDSRVPLPVYEALRDQSTTMSAVFGEQEVDRAMTEPAPAERVRIHLSTPNYFNDLGIRAVVGRTLTRYDANDNPGDPPVVLSLLLLAPAFQRRSESAWQNHSCPRASVCDCRSALT